MSRMSTPFKHPKTNVYYLRVNVPKDLRAIVGKSELKRSLGTKNLEEAKQLFGPLFSEAMHTLRAARDQKDGITKTLTSKDISELADRWLSSEVIRYQEEGSYADLVVTVPSSNTDISQFEHSTAFELDTLEALNLALGKNGITPDFTRIHRMFAHHANEI